LSSPSRNAASDIISDDSPVASKLPAVDSSQLCGVTGIGNPRNGQFNELRIADVQRADSLVNIHRNLCGSQVFENKAERV
jgi:hypothetical protein